MAYGWFYVYVVELDDGACLGDKSDPSLPYLYVGISGNPAEKRFAIHKEGGRTSNELVFNYGVKLRPDLYKHYGALREREASDFEQHVAEELREKGYVVYAGKPGLPWQRFR